MFIKSKKSQSITEYTLFIAAVIAGLIALQVYFQRGVKGNIKQRADSIGSQFTADEDYTIEETSQVVRSSESGYVNKSGSEFWSFSEVQDTAGGSGVAPNVSNDWISSLSNAGAKKTSDYSSIGSQYSSTDYVEADEGTEGDIGEHGSFDSGVLANKTPWEDAGLE